MSFGVAIIGCGLIGHKRAKALGSARLVACMDINFNRAEALARAYPGAIAYNTPEEALENKSVNIVIIATLHDSLADLSRLAVSKGKHVLVEKPAARRVSELDGLIELADKCQVIVRVGFNHRYHRALRKARSLIDDGFIGPLMFIRARYGHGGRVGYNKEWRSNHELSGGGELIDQGPHIIDLSRWFLGDFHSIDGHASTFYWDMKVDDNGFLILKTRAGQVAFLHVSCTEWKNIFSFEIYGRDGKIDISGLGGSYGLEKITFYKMLPEMGPPETTSWEYPMGDDSWLVEFQEFLDDIRLNRKPSANIQDAIATLNIIETIYRKSGYDFNT